MRIITLTTDFGTKDWFVGSMKGVMLGIAPAAVLVDLTHGVPPGDVRAGAFALAASCHFFPPGTVHLVVVDPGVGGPRQALVVETARYLFVAPDNGVLTLALRREEMRQIRSLERASFWREELSRTFHGRDIFAPVAAHLIRGLPLHQLGRPLHSLKTLSWPEPIATGQHIRGEVIYIDQFGNAITNIPNEVVRRAEAAGLMVSATGRKVLGPVVDHYQAVPRGRGLAVPGSSGFIEVAVNGGSAALQYRLQTGTPIRLVPAGRRGASPSIRGKTV